MFGKFSEKRKISAVNKNGVYVCQILAEENQPVKEAVLVIKSAQGNADAQFGNGIKGDWYISYETENSSKNESCITYFQMNAYSYDGISWKEYTGGIVNLKAAQTLYISIKKVSEEKEIGGVWQDYPNEEGKEWVYSVTDKETAKLKIGMNYNHFVSDLLADMKTGKVSVHTNLEMYE